MTVNKTNTATICPLCGKGNVCSVAQGLSGENCWCMGAKIDKAVLEQRLAKIDKTNDSVGHCICERCAETLASDAANQSNS